MYQGMFTYYISWCFIHYYKDKG